jgi:Zn-dependent protease with chaperone function
VRVDRSAELADEAAAVANRRRALVLCLLPGAALGIVVAIVLVALGFVLVALGALVVAVIGVALWLRATSADRVVAALGARPSAEVDRPRLHNLVDGLCATMGLERPEILVVDSPLANSLVVGRDAHRSSLVVTSGLEQRLSLVELEGVLAHELVHVKREDAVLAGVAVAVSSLWSLVAGEAAGAAAVHRLVGPGREYAADQRAAQVVRYPEGIAAALAAMSGDSTSEDGGAGGGGAAGSPWPPGAGRTARLTTWLWIDPLAGGAADGDGTGELDDTRVRAAALGLR